MTFFCYLLRGPVGGWSSVWSGCDSPSVSSVWSRTSLKYRVICSPKVCKIGAGMKQHPGEGIKYRLRVSADDASGFRVRHEGRYLHFIGIVARGAQYTSYIVHVLDPGYRSYKYPELGPVSASLSLRERLFRICIA